MKIKHHYIADIHAQGHSEQAQTDCEASQLHEVHMAHIEASTQKEKMRHERRVLKYQLQIEEAKVKRLQQNFFDTPNQVLQNNLDSSHILPNPLYQAINLGLVMTLHSHLRYKNLF